ncbi:MAG: stage III sporulation protein AB [Firmicutes bacterium]|jgi:stage III sporulation protein AB|nr:stage III sporulation protein AB [Bacillota bacterium]
MILKLLGALILIFATGNIGFTMARSLKRRVLLLSQLQGLLQFLVTEIDFAVTLLPEALIKVGESMGPEIDHFCQEVVSSLQLGLPLSIAWERSLSTLSDITSLSGDDTKPLKALAPVLGLSDRKDQLRHLKLAQEHLRQREVKAEQEANQNQKLWCYLGVLSGLVIVLILV